MIVRAPTEEGIYLSCFNLDTTSPSSIPLSFLVLLSIFTALKLFSKKFICSSCLLWLVAQISSCHGRGASWQTTTTTLEFTFTSYSVFHSLLLSLCFSLLLFFGDLAVHACRFRLRVVFFFFFYSALSSCGVLSILLLSPPPPVFTGPFSIRTTGAGLWPLSYFNFWVLSRC